MFIELPIKEETHLACERAEETRAMVGFRLAEDKLPQCMFVLAHGSRTGVIEHAGHGMTLTQTLKAILAKGAKEKGVTHVFTISCHGAAQEKVEIDGVSIQSIHTRADVIQSTSRGFWLEDGYAMIVDLHEDELCEDFVRICNS